VNENLLQLIYELLNHRDLTPAKERLIIEELELHGCCKTRIEFERRVLLRLREATHKGCDCPQTLKNKVKALLDDL
jgi:hypothetical protein